MVHVAQARVAADLTRVKDLLKYPELRFLDRFDVAVPAVLGVGVFLLGVLLKHVAPGLGTNGWQILVWGFFISTVAVYHGTYTINSLSHVFGRQRYKTGDASRNNPWLALITLGEGWHNNHHHYPASVRQGFYWWEFDITFYMLKLMSLFRGDLGLEAGAGGDPRGGRQALLTGAPCQMQSSMPRPPEAANASGTQGRRRRRRVARFAAMICRPYTTDFRRLYRGATPLVLLPRSVDEVARILRDLQPRRVGGGAPRRQYQLLRRRDPR